MPSEFNVLAKEIFPPSEEDGWGDTVFKFRTSAGCNFQSIGNCGLTVVQNVSADINCITQAPRAKFKKDEWGYADTKAWDEAYWKFRDDLLAKRADELFEEIRAHIAKAGAYNCYLLTDAVNRHSKARTSAPTPAHTPNTAWFARQLVARKIGYIVQSPVSVNHIHRTKGDFSLIRTWIWYPPEAMAFKPDKLLGYGTILKKSQVQDKLLKGNLFGTSVSKSLVEEYLDSYKV